MPKSFGQIFGETWSVLRERWFVLLGAALVLSFLPAIIMTLGYYPLYGTIPEEFTTYDAVQGAIGLLLTILLTLAVLEHLRAGKGTLGESVSAGLQRYWEALLLTILLLLALLGLFVLLIIPGIIFGIYWAFAYYALVEGKGIKGSFAYSRQLVKGRWWRVFWYTVLLFLILFGISFAVLIPFMVAMVIGAVLGQVPGNVTFALFVAVNAALSALATVFSLVFYERFYRALKEESGDAPKRPGKK